AQVLFWVLFWTSKKVPRPQGRNPAFSKHDRANDHWKKTDYDYDNETPLQAFRRELIKPTKVSLAGV
ncbi:MAG: hypothetical protein ACOCVU_01460, partial [Desulfohalobiaceae bacterium]